jgi:hypothetical protein
VGIVVDEEENDEEEEDEEEEVVVVAAAEAVAMGMVCCAMDFKPIVACWTFMVDHASGSWPVLCRTIERRSVRTGPARFNEDSGALEST